VATQYLDGSSHDWLDDVITFDVLARRQAAGVTDLRAKIDWRKSAALTEPRPSGSGLAHEDATRT
jgi:hypothetical protein